MSGFVTGREVVNPQIGYKGVFAKMQKLQELKPFQEYPKELRIELESGAIKRVVVGSLKEELDYRATSAEKVQGSTDKRHPVESERDELAAQLSNAQRANRDKDEQMATMQAHMEEMMRRLAALETPKEPVVAETPEDILQNSTVDSVIAAIRG